MRLAGTLASLKSTTTWLPIWCRLTWICGSESLTITRPAPSAPRRKSMARSSRRPLPPVAAAEHDDGVAAVDARLIRHELVEVQHQARAVLGLGGEYGVEAGGVHVDAGRRQGTRRGRSVKSNG